MSKEMQLGARYTINVERFIDAPNGAYGDKKATLLSMEVGDAFFVPLKSEGTYRRLFAYLKRAKNYPQQWGFGTVDKVNGRGIVWRKS